MAPDPLGQARSPPCLGHRPLHRRLVQVKSSGWTEPLIPADPPGWKEELPRPVGAGIRIFAIEGVREHHSAVPCCQIGVMEPTDPSDVRFERPSHGGVHVLRHTFCSYLARERRAAARYSRVGGASGLGDDAADLHLSPAAIDGAIRLLEAPTVHAGRGNMVATGSTEMTNSFQ